jgi:uncharacterized protein YhbP (UPF0306 family)
MQLLADERMPAMNRYHNRFAASKLLNFMIWEKEHGRFSGRSVLQP